MLFEKTLRPEPRTYVVVGIVAFASTLLLHLLSGTDLLQALYVSGIVSLATSLTLFSLKAVIKIDGDVLEIDYVRATFADKLSNIKTEATEKFLFKDDPLLALGKLYLGTRIIGFYVGWYTLKDGSAAYVCVSRRRRARALATKDGVRLILDPGIAKALSKRIDELTTA